MSDYEDETDSPFYKLDKYDPDKHQLPASRPATRQRTRMLSSSRASNASPAPPAPPNVSAAVQQAPAFTNMLPHAGHHADLQLINSMVNELCDVHAGNRKAMDEMIAKYEELRLSYEEVTNSLSKEQANGSIAQSVSRSEHEALKTKLRQAQEQHKEIVQQYDELHTTNTEYEDVMASMMMKVREFADAHTTTLIGWHKYYNTIIQQLRDESLQKSLEHSQWQESLGRLNTYVREAYRSYNEESNPLYYKIAYLKRENKVMRSLLGWPEQEFDSDDERDAEEERMENLRRETERVMLAEQEAVNASAEDTRPMALPPPTLPSTAGPVLPFPSQQPLP